MKLITLLGALLLSPTPAFADDLVYLNCQGKFTSKVVNLNSSGVIQENKGRHSKTYIIDIQRRMVMSRGGQWFNAEIINGILTSSWTLGQGKTTNKETVSMHFNPAGSYSSKKNIRQGNISMDVETIGSCDKIDAADFGAEANQ